MNGTHIISNFYECENKDILFDKSLLKKEVEKLIINSGLTVIGNKFHKFKNAGVTGIFLLAESHLSVHTWPEKNNSLNLDIFTCNYSENNDEKTKKLFSDLKFLFDPKKNKTKIIKR